MKNSERITLRTLETLGSAIYRSAVVLDTWSGERGVSLPLSELLFGVGAFMSDEAGVELYKMSLL